MASVALWALTTTLAANAPAPSVSVYSPLVKVRPGPRPPGAASEATLSLARGECEAVQVALKDGSPRLTPSPLQVKGPGAPLTATLYREGFLQVKTPSNAEGAQGFWPDPLLPLSASVPAHLPQVFYVEFCAPRSQQPGRYAGQWEMGPKGGAALPFTVEVRPFTVPATSSLPNSFGLSLYSVAKGHKLKPEASETHALLQRYASALLAHRLSPHGLTMEAPPLRFEGKKVQVDFRAYDQTWGPFLEGTALPSGARFTTLDVRDSTQATTPEQKTAYFRAVAEHFQQKGWKAQPFFYAKDEPKPEDAPTVRKQAMPVQAAKGIPVLVTSPLDPLFTPSADILAPTLNCFFDRPGPATCRKVLSVPRLREALAKKTRVWWYQSCNSHGCKGGPAADASVERAYSGWASYMVDHPGPLNRAMGPLAFTQGVDGELYFDTLFAYNAQDPWEDVFAFGGNGDGTLFYPGQAKRLGSAEDQPVLSLRLKNIRDGLEDYEYLTLLKDRAFALKAAQRLAHSGADIERSPQVWEQVRAELSDRLSAEASRSP